MLYAHPDERVECGTCEPGCPAEATFYQDDEPEQRAQSTAENASFCGPLGSPEGASKTRPLPDEPAMPASCITSR